MAPARRESEPPVKRQRIGSTVDKYTELKAAQHALQSGDALSAPALSEALDALIRKKKVSDADRKRVEVTLKNVKTSLDSLSKKTMSVDSAVTRNVLRRAAKGISVSILFRGDRCQNLTIPCVAPTRVNVVGSFLLGFSSRLVADVAVEMPSGLFESRDYLNYRYHDKRLLYLIYLARLFCKTEEQNWCNVSLETSFLNGDAAKPVLCVSHVDQPGVTIRLLPSYADDVFGNKFLGDDRCNVRRENTPSLVGRSEDATMAYNASIIMDSKFVPTLQSLHSAVTGVPAFTDTILLLESWCSRHRLLKGKFVLTAIVADIISRAVAPRRASRENLLRCALNSIRGGILRKLSIAGVRISASMDVAFLQRFEDSATAALCAIESKTATEDPWFGILSFLFCNARGRKTSPRPLSTLFDGFICLSPVGDAELPSKRELQFVLHQSLVVTGRVQSIEMLNDDLFGIQIVSEDDVRRKVDMCPETANVTMFKTFWGSKSGLRRFKDGKIVEALVWKGGLGTLNEMCTYAVQKCFGDEVKTKVILGDLERAAGLFESDVASKRAIAAFDELASMLRSLEGLPLGIRAVHASSPHLRLCGAYPIRPNEYRSFIEPLDIVASFETSGAWPDDPVAISAAKAAFYVALKSALAEKGLASKATISFLEIVLAGFVFRLRIRVDKEKKALPEGSEDVDALTWETEKRVLHQDNIKHVGNSCMGSVATIAKRWLSSHFLLSHMGKRADEMIEILVATVMSRSELSQRRSAMGYFCQFLHLVAEFPWEACPLTLLLQDRDKAGDVLKNQEENELEQAQFIECAQKRFAEKADGLLPFTIYSAWNEDKDDAATWFPKKHCPERVIADRIVATARSTLGFIESHLQDAANGSSLQTIFEAPTDVYDLILELDSTQTPFGQSTSKKRFRSTPRSRSDVVGLDPVQKLRDELEKRLGTFAVFLTENVGRAQIFVVWRPTASSDVKFSLKDAPFREPVDNEASLKPSREQLIEEMLQIGQGFVLKVTVPEGAATAIEE